MVKSVPPHLPSKQEIRRFIDESGGRAGKREVGKAFGIKGQDRIWLKRLLKEIEAERASEGLPGRKDHPPRERRAAAAGKQQRLPPVGVIEVTEADEDGALLCRPMKWASDAPPPRIELVEKTVRGPAARPGDQFLARLGRDGSMYQARVLHRLEVRPRRIFGVYQQAMERGRGGRVQPTDRKLRQEMIIEPGHDGGAVTGDLVLVETLPGRPLGPRLGKVVEVVGSFDDPRAISLLALQTHEIPGEFSPAALGAATEAMPVTEPGNRTDLRDMPLVTIDPPDARDHDDAIHAVADDDPDNPGGYRLTVAIADVAWYVRPDSPIDRDAQLRGVSVYFPDRVAPMLPERLSADLCSLKPGEDRPVMAVEMVIDATGRKRRHRFFRAMMRSAANIAYADAQAAIDGDPRPELDGLLETVLKPLFAAWKLLDIARHRRGPLELDLPERKVLLGDDGYIAGIVPQERLDAHRVVEEFMVLANVCAAETLERRGKPCVYRVHEPPDPERLQGLKDFLGTLGLSFSAGDVVKPKMFNRALSKVAGQETAPMVSEAVLRAQTAAYYDTDNLGHFGLALRRYAHFTSPIRRYADLLVHRALIDAMGAGAGGLGDTDADTVQRLAEQTSTFERRAMLAERDALDRFTAIYLQDRVGADFSARISGITRFGMFVALSETGASGIIPMRSLNSDFFDFDEAAMQLVGRRTGKVWRLGERLTVRLKEASPVTGGLAFEIVDPGRGDGTGKGSLKGPGRGSLKPHRPPPGQKRSKSRRRKG